MDFGTGVSRTLDAISRQFAGLVWQEGKPPLDSELNLMSQQAWESLREVVRAEMPSGFIMDPTRAMDEYQFDSLWSNRFVFGRPRDLIGVKEGLEQSPITIANVNGWIIPVIGTDVDVGLGDNLLSNVIKLYPPPSSLTRIDFVFLEAWVARVDPNPTTLNKPTASTLWNFGNVKYGSTNLVDDLEDPAIGWSTTGRIQVQYRIRVVGTGEGAGVGVDLAKYPDGFDDTNVLAQGAAGSPIGGYLFENMREKMGDPSLWRSGSGDALSITDLGTVDGYTYAIPICAIFRRNTRSYVAVESAGLPEQNGAKDRTPHTKNLPDKLDGARILLQASLGADISATLALPADVLVTNLNGCGLEDPEHAPYNTTFLVIGEEYFGFDSIDLVFNTVHLTSRGRFGTSITRHESGTLVNLYNTRPDDLYADQIAATDIIDLRRTVNAHDWDYQRILQHNVAALVRGDLKTAWKKSTGGDTQGTTVHEVDYLLCSSGGPAPAGVQQVDGPDGIRTVFSDAACIQRDVTILLDNAAVKVNQYADTLDAGVAWDVGPDFHPTAFFNTSGYLAGADIWTNGSTIFLHLGGTDGFSGARATFKDAGTQAVRAIMPDEYWKTGYPVVDPKNGNQYPVTARFLNSAFSEPPPECLDPTGNAAGTTTFAERHPGPMYPVQFWNFESPFIALGGIVRRDMKISCDTSDITYLGSDILDLDTGINFDTYGDFYTTDTGAPGGNILDDPTTVSSSMSNGRKTLWNLLTKGGSDPTGYASELYVVIYGDTDADGLGNNGVFQVIGAGSMTSMLTTSPAASATKIHLRKVCNLPDPEPTTAQPITVEFRSIHHNSDDISDQSMGFADVSITITNLEGVYTPWSRTDLGYLAGDGYDLSLSEDGTVPYLYSDSKLLINMTLLYHPGRGAMSKVPDQLLTFAKKYNPTIDLGGYLRQSKATLDGAFVASAGVPSNETDWDPIHVQTWNRLPSLGWHAPDAPQQGPDYPVNPYGGNVVGFTEQDREHELFFDRGSKTVVFRPFRDREMTVKAMTVPDAVLTPIGGDTSCLLGPMKYPDGFPKDCRSIWTAKKTQAFAVPREFMPRFGRQDIPYWTDINAGGGPFLQGINHLFTDIVESSNDVFKIIGGEDIVAGPLVKSMFFATGTEGPVVPAVYGHQDTFPAPVLNQPFIGARKTTDIPNTSQAGRDLIATLGAVNSSDFGRGLKGIQLPPYYGPARVYGVYRADDYQTKGGHTFNSDRITPVADPPPNLLREDAINQTLFILEGGARDVTIETGYDGKQDHTYIIPSESLDITRALGYVPGDKFEDYHYVVECVVFGFARGFINENNYVMTRLHGGDAVLNTDGLDPELEGIRMTIPAPAGISDNFYAAYNRTPYQGDPFMSRNGDAQANADYVERYGQLSPAQQYAIRTPIQQFNSVTQEYIPQMPNPRAFEILASMDFYTTLGTGKIGGQMYPGTCLDVGYTEDMISSAARMPPDPSAPPVPAWRVLPRAFTEGQRENPTRASLTLAFSPRVLNYSSTLELNPAPFKHHRLRFNLLDGTSLDMYASFPANDSDITGFGPGQLGLPSSQLWHIDEGITLTKPGSIQSVFQDELLNGSIFPGQVVEIPVSVPGVTTFAKSTVYAQLLGAVQPNLVLQMRVDPAVPDWAYIRVIHTWSDFAFDDLSGHITVYTVPPPGWIGGGAPIPAGGSDDLTGIPPMLGAVVGDLVVVTATPPSGEAVYTGRVTGPDTVIVTCHNVGTVGIPGGIADFHTNIRIAVLKQTDYASREIDMTALGLTARVTHTYTVGTLENCAYNLYRAILFNPTLQRNLLPDLSGTDVNLWAVPLGPDGNNLSVQSMFWSTDPADFSSADKIYLKTPTGPYSGSSLSSTNAKTLSNFIGGEYYPANAGVGDSQVNLTGMTERLPMGVLLQDSDFLCENPLDDNASAMKSSAVGPRPIQSLMPLTSGGEEFTRFMGEPGSLIGQSEGSVCVTDYSPWTQTNMLGKRVYRTYRGSPVYVMSGDAPGGPIDWVTESISAPLTPLLKGGALACRALLVRNFYEEITSGGDTYAVSNGDEIQMVIVTNGVLGNGFTRQDGLTLDGIISPSGYGEGTAASDRYRVDGRPMFRGRSQWIPNPNLVADTLHPQLAVYPDGLRNPPAR